MTVTPLRALDRVTLARASETLAARDRDLAGIVQRFGTPPLWARRPGFVTLVRIVLEQQVSLASGRAAFARLAQAAGAVTPERLIETGQARLRQAGLTRQKARYCIELAGAVTSGRLDLRAVSRADDDAAMAMLTAVTGVGPWTAECYLLMALRRPDVWPAGDIALATAAQEIKRLRRRPSPERLTRLAEAWRPHRATAARLLWHHYLSRRANDGS